LTTTVYPSIVAETLRDPISLSQQKGDVTTEGDRRECFSLVDRSLQYRFLVMILTYSAMIMIFLALFLFLPDIMKLYDEGLSLEARGIAADRILTLHARVWPAVIALICIIGMHSFRALLWIVGPLYRFRPLSSCGMGILACG
jgi:hypothetical protein